MTCRNEHGFFYHFIHMESGKRMGKVRGFLDRHFPAALRRANRPSIFWRSGNQRPRDENLRARRLAVDAEWRNDAFHGVAPRVRLPGRPLGTLLRADDDLPARRLALPLIRCPPIPGKPGRGRSSSIRGLNTSPATIRSSRTSIRRHGLISAKKRDAYTDYFENSIKATKAHKLFCLSLHERFPDYSEDLWGISASD